MNLSEYSGVDGLRLNFEGEIYLVCDWKHIKCGIEHYISGVIDKAHAISVINVNAVPVRPNVYQCFTLLCEWNAEKKLTPVDVPGALRKNGEYDILRDVFSDKITNDKVPVERIVTCGRIGVCKGALEGAYELGFPIGGIVPAGMKLHLGIWPTKFDFFNESLESDYDSVARLNVIESDATLVIVRKNRAESCKSVSSLIDYLSTADKPYMIIDRQEIDKVVEWLQNIKHNSQKEQIILHIFGPSEESATGIQLSTKCFVRRLLRKFICLGDQTVSEVRRISSLSSLWHDPLKWKLYSEEELAKSIKELKDAKIRYLKKFNGAEIPRWIKDPDDLDMQIRNGSPFGLRDEDLCDYCFKTHHRSCLFGASSDNGQHPSMKDDCVACYPGWSFSGPYHTWRWLYLDPLDQKTLVIPSLLEVKFIAMALYLKNEIIDAQTSNNATRVKELEQIKEKWQLLWQELEMVLYVRDGYLAYLMWGIQTEKGAWYEEKDDSFLIAQRNSEMEFLKKYGVGHYLKEQYQCGQNNWAEISFMIGRERNFLPDWA